MLKKALLPAVCLCLCCSCIFAQVTSLQQLTDSIQAIVTQKKTPGLLVGIVKDDAVYFTGGFGFSDLSVKKPVTEQSLFRMGSISKMFVSLAILKLARENKLTLNDELKKIAPEVSFQNKWEKEHPVRIVHLLEHTSGFDDMKLNRMCSQDDRVLTGINMVTFQKNSLECRWKPGERFAYSNPGYVVLGYLIEKLTGQPYDQYITDNIIAPLGMERTYFGPLPGRFPDLEVKEYVVRKGTPVQIPAITLLTPPSGALWSSAGDMVKMLRFFINQGQPLFDSSVIREMETIHNASSFHDSLDAGYALGNYNTPYIFMKQHWRGHGGLTGACFSMFAYSHALRAGFIISSNGNRRDVEVERLLIHYLEQGLPEWEFQTQAVSAATLQSYAGQYQLASPRFKLTGFQDQLLNSPRVIVHNDSLYIDGLMTGKTSLLHITGNRFAEEGANLANVHFLTRDDGKMVMIWSGVYFEKVSRTGVFLRFWLMAVSLLLAVLTMVVGLGALIAFFLKKITSRQLLMALLPGIAFALLIWAYLNLNQVQSESYLLNELGNINRRTLIIFGGSLLFGILTLVNLILNLGQFRRKKNKWAAAYWLISALALLYVGIVLYSNGLIGLRTWAL